MGLIPNFKQATVVTGGIAVPLLSGTPQENVVSFAVVAVTGTAYLGDSTVLASTKVGIPITQVPLVFSEGGHAGYDLAKLYVDGATSAVVNVLYFTRYGG